MLYCNIRFRQISPVVSRRSNVKICHFQPIVDVTFAIVDATVLELDNMFLLKHITRLC